VSGRKPEARCSLFEPAAFDALRERLDGVDLTRAVYLGRGTQVTAYRAGDWVIRVPRTVAARKKVARQTRVYQILAARGLPVPRDAQIAHDADGEVTAGLYRYVPGVPASAARRSPVLARDLGAFLTALHAVPLEPVRACCTVLGDLWTDRFRIRWERSRSHLPAAERQWLEGVIALFLASPETTSTRLVLIHGDLVEEHVLVGPDGRLAGVIDPSGPRIADPALDFGTLAERFGWAFTDAVLTSYAGPRDPGFQRRACFCANVRPLVTIEAGLRDQSEERLRLGLRRLAERMAEGREFR
jgi:aminoglycoside phosphotransferase (APT) family kinase protein